MAEEQTETLSLIAAYAFGATKGLEKEVAAIRNMEIRGDLARYGSRIRRGYMAELFEARGVMDEFKDQHWQAGKTSAGEAKRKRYLRIKEEYEKFLANQREGDEGERSPEVDEETTEEQQFAAEADLRDFLAKNPSCIEPGLKLFTSEVGTGVEYPIEGGFIDILCVDSKGRYVVVELKVGRGRNKTIGQLLYYMGWVDKNLKGPCRGMIIAKEISDDLRLAVQRVTDVSLHTYKMSVTVEGIAKSS